MFNIIKIVFFCLVIWVGFAAYTLVGIPLIIPAAPPVEERLTGEITMEQFVALGDRVFHGKGTCTLCHNALLRAPLLDSIGAEAEAILKDPRYKGEATTGEEYLHESLVHPSAFVVAGFGKKGTNDTVSPMADVSKGAIALSDVEMDAVTAYLQSSAGVDVTVALPSGDAPVEEEEVAEVKPAENATEALMKFECSMCHTHPLIEEGGDTGPDLTPLVTRAATMKKGMSAKQYLVEAILDPNAMIVEPDTYDEDTMPDDYADRMTVTEMNMIVDALLGKEEKKEGGE